MGDAGCVAIGLYYELISGCVCETRVFTLIVTKLAFVITGCVSRIASYSRTYS